MKRSILSAVAAVAVSAALAFGLARSEPAETPTQTIAEIVAGSKDHATLAALLKESGLIGAFSSPGQFTLFAPTDMAFAKLGKATLDDLKKPQNRGKLMEILTSHAVPRVIKAADVQSGDLTMMSGKAIPVKVDSGKVTIGGANVVTADVMATNGVIHIIDGVIVPK
ncbi:MAG: fasciclin domain-containing protein [Tepidisphaerales bacterium]